MPVTGTLGALTYSKTILGSESWVMHFATSNVISNPVQFKSMDMLNNEVFIAGGLNIDTSSGGFPDAVYSNSFVISVLTDSTPRILYSTEYLRNLAVSTTSSINGVTDTINFTVANTPFGKFFVNDMVRFSGGGGGVSSTTPYYLKTVGLTGVTISTSVGGPTANLTSLNPFNSAMVSLVANSSSGEFYPNDIKFSSYDTTLKYSGHMELTCPSGTDELSTEYAGSITLDVDGTVNSAVRFLPISQPNTNTIANTQSCMVLPISSGNIITSQVYYIQNTGASVNGNAFNVITRIDNNNVNWQRTSTTINFGTSTDYPYVYTALLGQTSDGNVINVINSKYPALPFPNSTIRTEYAMSVNKLNVANGSTIWKRGVDQFGGANINNYQGPFVSLGIDTTDNIYITSKEINLDTSAFSTRGSFIVKFDNSGSTVWQKHYVINSSNTTQIEDITIDSSDNIYFIARGPLNITGPIETSPATVMIIGQLDTSGNTVWCNKMTFSNPMTMFPLRVKSYNGSLYILGENGDNNIGMLFKVPSDGTIPGNGTYPINDGILSYTIVYTTDTLNIANANMRLDTISTANLANSTPIQFSNAVYSDDPVTILKGTSPLG